MAALGPDKELKLCAHCFFVLPEGAETCPDCGGSVDETAQISGANAEIYPELARANLFRMRGEYRKAEDVCRAILRRFPNNATAAGLLGDICVEEEQYEDAVRWYELAIDSAPDSPAERRKLEVAQRRLHERQALSTAQQLGIPESKPKAGLFAALLFGFIVVVGFAAYLLGKTNTEANLNRTGAKHNVPFETQGSPNVFPTQGNADVQNPDSPVASVPVVENQLLNDLKAKSPEGARLIDAYQDPRTKTVYLAIRLEEGDNDRITSAHLARTAFEHILDAPRMKIRGIKKGADAYFADAERTATMAVDMKLAESDPTAFANAILTSEHPPVSTENPANGAGSSPNATTGGDSDPVSPTTGGDGASGN